jgi:hypothetical protein
MMKAAEWVKALRSGAYRQTQRTLSDGKGGFCCLGVLCEAKGLPKKLVHNTGLDENYVVEEVYYVFDGGPASFDSGPAGGPPRMSSVVIPQKYQPTILEDLDLSQMVVFRGDEDELSSHLMLMNDAGLSFDEIADYIEGVVAGNE